jgi:hypothetical protein
MGSARLETVSGKLAGLRRRLEKAEKALGETVEQEKLANCICKIGTKLAPTIVRSDQAEELEAEMNQKCAVHGFRDLGAPIIVIRITDLPGERFRIDDLLDEYKARKSAYEKAKLENVNQEV